VEWIEPTHDKSIVWGLCEHGNEHSGRIKGGGFCW